MARKLALKSIPFNGVSSGNGAEVPQLNFGATLMEMLRNPPPGRGLSYAEVMAAVDALIPVQKAVDENAETVVLSDDQWRTLCQKLDTFSFSFADLAIVQFGKEIREAREVGMEGQEVES